MLKLWDLGITASSGLDLKILFKSYYPKSLYIPDKAIEIQFL